MRNKSIVSTNCRGYLRWGAEREADCYGQKRSQEGGKRQNTIQNQSRSQEGGKRTKQQPKPITQSGRGQAIQTTTKTNQILSAPPQVPGPHIFHSCSILSPAKEGLGTCMGALGSGCFWLLFVPLAPFPTACSVLYPLPPSRLVLSYVCRRLCQSPRNNLRCSGARSTSHSCPTSKPFG